VDQESCNRCHVDLRYHGDHWRNVTACLLCHTSGAEDSNDPNVAGGTPGVSIDFRVLMHKIHDGRHLPSVLGVTTNPDGSRDYSADPKPYLVADSDGTVHDYSTTGFPVWPTRTLPLLKVNGWSALSPEQQALELALRTGITDCAVCHGNTNPGCATQIEGPAQGAIAYTEPSIRACYSCHDDVLPAYPYVSNFPPEGCRRSLTALSASSATARSSRTASAAGSRSTARTGTR
jgi:OmcA/MtrC family decaheme c-type cytochrome